MIAGYLLARLDKRGEQQQGQGVTLAQIATRLDALEGRGQFWNSRCDKVPAIETRLDALEATQDEHGTTLKGWDRLVAEVTHMREAIDRIMTFVENFYQHAAAPSPPPSRGTRRKRAA